MIRVALVLALVVALVAPATAGAERRRILVLTAAKGFVHPSIPDGVAMLRRHSGFRVTVTRDPRRVRDLDRYAAVVFLQTTGEVLTGPQFARVRRYVRAGGGWLGVHAAADGLRGIPAYRDTFLHTEFAGHPPTQRATVVVEDRAHPAAAGLPRRWTRTDEWYGFTASPRADPTVRVVLSLDEATYDPGTTRMGDHPVAWWSPLGRGRAFYTALGHTKGSYAEPAFRRHVLGALRFVATAR